MMKEWRKGGREDFENHKKKMKKMRIEKEGDLRRNMKKF